MGRQIDTDAAPGADLFSDRDARAFLIDLLERKAVRLDETRYPFVLDEADRCSTWASSTRCGGSRPLLRRDRQTMMFSATMPKLMADLSGAVSFKDPVRVEAAPPGVAADKIAQSVHFVAQGEKTALLGQLLPGIAASARWSSHAPSTVRGERPDEEALVVSGFRRGLDPRQQEPGPARPGHSRIPGGATSPCSSRPTWPPAGSHSGREPRLQLRTFRTLSENYVHRIGRTARGRGLGQGRGVLLERGDRRVSRDREGPRRRTSRSMAARDGTRAGPSAARPKRPSRAGKTSSRRRFKPAAERRRDRRRGPKGLTALSGERPRPVPFQPASASGVGLGGIPRPRGACGPDRTKQKGRRPAGAPGPSVPWTTDMSSFGTIIVASALPRRGVGAGADTKADDHDAFPLAPFLAFEEGDRGDALE